MFHTHRLTDEDDEDNEERENGSVVDEVPSTLAPDEFDLSNEESKAETKSSVPYSPVTPTSPDSSSEPSSTAVSVFSYHPQMVSKPVTVENDDTQMSAISRALWLNGFHTGPFPLSAILVVSGSGPPGFPFPGHAIAGTYAGNPHWHKTKAKRFLNTLDRGRGQLLQQ